MHMAQFLRPAGGGSRKSRGLDTRLPKGVNGVNSEVEISNFATCDAARNNLDDFPPTRSAPRINITWFSARKHCEATALLGVSRFERRW